MTRLIGATTTRSARSLIFIVSNTLATAGFPCTTHKGFPANVCSLPSSYGAYTTPNANASDARRRRPVSYTHLTLPTKA